MADDVGLDERMRAEEHVDMPAFQEGEHVLTIGVRRRSRKQRPRDSCRIE